MFKKRGTFKGGVLLKHNKNTEDCETKIMPIPSKIIMPVSQNIGAPLDPIVKRNDEVKVGQVIADSKAFVTAPIHSSVSGKVKEITEFILSNGTNSKAIVIEPDFKQVAHEYIGPKKYNTKEEFLNIVRESGLVGLGGAGFPTHVKLNPPEGKKIDYLIINAAECEPYITSDDREAIENSWNVINGIKLVCEILDVEKVCIGVEDNKPKAIEELTRIADSDKNIDIVKLKSKYPQGAEKMLIHALVGREVPEGGLPADVGCIVMNINTVSFIAQHIKTGMPLIKKRITVDGDCIKNPMNVEVPIGTPIKDILDFVGGLKKEPRKIIMGGPMMGVTQKDINDPILKYTNSILVFSSKEAKLPNETACIRCGKCVDVCPMKLLPYAINFNINKRIYDEFDKLHVMNCIECGACSYICPANRHLVQSIRMAKVEYKKIQNSKGGN